MLPMQAQSISNGSQLWKFLPHTEGTEGACYSTPNMVVKRMREMQKAGGGSPEHATKVPHDWCMTATKPSTPSAICCGTEDDANHAEVDSLGLGYGRWQRACE
jgi:hypothetical protein